MSKPMTYEDVINAKSKVEANGWDPEFLVKSGQCLKCGKKKPLTKASGFLFCKECTNPKEKVQFT